MKGNKCWEKLNGKCTEYYFNDFMIKMAPTHSVVPIAPKSPQHDQIGESAQFIFIIGIIDSNLNR